MHVCKTSLKYVVVYQNDCSYVCEFIKPTCDSIGNTEPQKCQNWGVGPWTGMGACPGQYGTFISPYF